MYVYACAYVCMFYVNMILEQQMDTLMFVYVCMNILMYVCVQVCIFKYVM